VGGFLATPARNSPSIGVGGFRAVSAQNSPSIREKLPIARLGSLPIAVRPDGGVTDIRQSAMRGVGHGRGMVLSGV
jgi:hypothetical protein